MRTIIRGGKIISHSRILDDQILILENGRIAVIIPSSDFISREGDYEIDAGGKWVAPGLIDLHVHGSDRADAMDADCSAVQTLNTFFATKGVTAYLLTTGSAPDSHIQAVIENFQNLDESMSGAVPLGIHLEGPYLCQERRGAQPPEQLRNPDPAEYHRWFDSGTVRLMTIAPELPGAMELIRYGVSKGVEFAVGHSAASYEIMQTAVDARLRQATHTFNGMDPLHHRHPGVVGAVLSDNRVFAQIIPDGVHVHPAVVKILIAAKGVDRTILITDAIRAAGLGDGEYDLLGQTVSVQDGVARVPSGSLAGSILTMDQALRNVMDFAGLGIVDAVSMASTTPAAALNLQQERGDLLPGMRADVVLLSENFQVDTTLVGGSVVYQKK